MSESYKAPHATVVEGAVIQGRIEDVLEREVTLLGHVEALAKAHPSAIRREAAWTAIRWGQRMLADLEGHGADDEWLAEGTPTPEVNGANGA